MGQNESCAAPVHCPYNPLVSLPSICTSTTSIPPVVIPELCRTLPTKLEYGAIHILRVKVLSSQPTDGTYADEGYGQGEFDTVKLLEVLRSPIHWTPGLVFRVHPFPGSERENSAPEHLIIGKQYFLIYTYYLYQEPHGNSDLIGLTRCGFHEDTPASRKLILDALRAKGR